MKSMLKAVKKHFSGKEEGVPSAPAAAKPSAPAAAPAIAAAPPAAAAGAAGAAGAATSNTNIIGTVLPDGFFTPLPSFRDCPSSERQNVLVRKLRLCSVVFDFKRDVPADAKAKELKRQTLLELVDHVSQSKNSFTEAVLPDVIGMVSTNLFRALPPAPFRTGFDAEEDEPLLDDAWPHLQIVYEFLLRFLVSTEQDTKVLKKYINHEFLVSLLELFDTEDPRERDYLKTILHRIYGKFMSLRAFIRTAINNVFFRFVYETERHNGIGELLEILGSIINGFALPLKEEHKNFLILVLTPLHKVKMLSGFHLQLAYCVAQFIEKDSSLSVPVLTQLIKFWPIQNSQKEVLFLNELEELLELTPPEHFKKFMVPLFKQVGRAIGSSHFQVAERALFLWNNEYVATLVSDFREVLLPLVYGPLNTNANSHWNATVHTLSQNVLKLFHDMDPALFDKCASEAATREVSKKEGTKVRSTKWAALQQKYPGPA